VKKPQPPIPTGTQDEPENPAAEAVAYLQGLRSENRGHLPIGVSDPPAQLVEKRPVERDSQNP